MARRCNCSGGCCGSLAADVNRRDFLTLIGAGAASAMIGRQAWADWLQNHTSPEELARWKKELMQSSPARVYRSGVHTDARMHLGGIGTGNIEIGVDGQFTNWQLFNTLRDGSVPMAFAVKAGNVVRLLQTAGGPDWPRVQQIEMTGEYPIATLRYIDAELPVHVELSAYTPFAPLDSRFSSQPLAVLAFRIKNPTAKKQTVSLAGFMQNPVGYDVCGGTFGGNVNEPFQAGAAKGLFMRAEPGKEASLDKPVKIFASANLQELRKIFVERPKNLDVKIIENDALEAVKQSELCSGIILLEETAANLSANSLRAAREAVQAGATLVFAGKTMPLLQSYANYCADKLKPAKDAHPDIVFDDFEHGYKNWTVEGTAFGQEPASGTLPGQQTVTGFVDKSLVNTFRNGDDSLGRLVSKPFTIERNYIHFLIGGGSHAATQIRLLVNDKVVRSDSGKNAEQLLPKMWDVREFRGQKAHIEIVDEQTGDWGHINVDQIVFSNYIGDSVQSLESMLPMQFTGILAQPDKKPGDINTLTFENLQLQPDAKQLTLACGMKLFARTLGKGRVIIASGAMLDPAQVLTWENRHRAYGALCELMAARYTRPLGIPPKAHGFGTLAFATLGDNATLLPACSEWNAAWEQFKTQGAFASPDQSKPNSPTAIGQTINGAVAATVDVPANGSVEIPFLLAWHYPNKYNGGVTFASSGTGVWIGCHYATLWPDAKAVIREAIENYPTIQQRTTSFRKTFYDSTLPYWLLDCITSQAATIRHIGIVFQIANGDIYGWEGSNGCCDPTCTHVWGYEQSLARLFPDLEKIMRRIDFKHQQRPDGGVNNRTEVPSPPHPTGEQPFADGHASCILKAYREALNHPDDSFFKEYWPHIKRAVEYLVARDAGTKGGQPDGILEDDQFNTYDEALHGVTTFISGYYLAALRAGEEWAKRMGDRATAERFHAIFLKGQANLVKRCWNGEYFEQDLPDYQKRTGEVGPGCMADQLIGQWWAHQLGLGYLLPQDKVRTALKSVFRYNWVPDLTGFKHAPRAFAGDNDKGLLICTWPKGGRPDKVMLYSDEVWTGIEYQVAAHMIYEGMIEEGFAIVKGARDRYDGIPRAPIGRNPWNEIECGGHYARAMASWSLLLALSGYEYDTLAKSLSFAPRITPNNFKAFFTGPEGWGNLRQIRQETNVGMTQRNELQVVEGRLVVAQLHLAAPANAKQARVTLGGSSIESQLVQKPDGATITFASPVTAKAGDALVITFT